VAHRKGGVMGYQKFSERPEGHHQTLGALDGLGGHDAERSKSQALRGEAQIVTLTPPKAPKPPKVSPISEIEGQTLGALVSGQDETEDFRPSSETWTDAQEERAAVIEFHGGAPRPWAEALARLDPANPPADVPLARWQQIIDDCGRFLDLGWANRAEALGWGPLHLFGCDRERPLARYDRMGLLWILQGRKLVALTAHTATIDTLTGSLQTYRRVPIGSDRIVLAWELAS
jgi:hypothetical protein